MELKALVRDQGPQAMAEPAASPWTTSNASPDPQGTLVRLALVREPQPVRRRQRGEQRDDQPVLGHWADRPPRCHPLLSHRPAQRHDGREAGSLSNPLPGHVKPPAPNTEVAAHGSVEQFSARSAIEQFDAMRNGRTKALWVARTSQAQSLPDQTHVREALAATH